MEILKSRLLVITSLTTLSLLFVAYTAQTVFSSRLYTKTVNKVQQNNNVRIELRSVSIQGNQINMDVCYSLPQTKGGFDYGIKDVTVALDGQPLPPDKVVMAKLKQWNFKDDADVMLATEAMSPEGSKKWLSKGQPSKRCDDLSFESPTLLRPSQLRLIVNAFGSAGPNEGATCDDVRAKLTARKLPFGLECDFSPNGQSWNYINLPLGMTLPEAQKLGYEAMTDYTPGPWVFETSLN